MGAVTDEDALAYGSGRMEYFSHDSRAHDDFKCRMLMVKGGLEAYGRWWLLCEALADMKGHRLPYSSDDDRAMAAMVLMCDEAECDEFLGWCAGLGLIDPELFADGVIVSSRMVRNSMEFGRKRAAGAMGGKSRKAKQIA